MAPIKKKLTVYILKEKIVYSSKFNCCGVLFTNTHKHTHIHTQWCIIFEMQGT